MPHNRCVPFVDGKSGTFGRKSGSEDFPGWSERHKILHVQAGNSLLLTLSPFQSGKSADPLLCLLTKKLVNDLSTNQKVSTFAVFN